MDRIVRRIEPAASKTQEDEPRAFSVFNDARNIVLLGDPGAGKPHTFREAPARCGGRYIRRMTETTSSTAAARRLGCRPAIARALLIASDRTVRRWEQNEPAVAGPAWVALEGMLRGKGEATLADRVATIIEQRRQR